MRLLSPPLPDLAVVDIPSWGGLVISALVAGGAFLLWLIKVQSRAVNDDGDEKLVSRLDKRIDELEDDLDRERQGRAEDNRRNAEQMQRLRDEHNRELQKLREDLADLRTAYEVMKAMAQGRWPDNHPNGGI